MKKFSDYEVLDSVGEMQRKLAEGWEVLHIFYVPEQIHVDDEQIQTLPNPNGYGNPIHVVTGKIGRTVISNSPRFIMACTQAVKVLYEDNRTNNNFD